MRLCVTCGHARACHQRDLAYWLFAISSGIATFGYESHKPNYACLPVCWHDHVRIVCEASRVCKVYCDWKVSAAATKAHVFFEYVSHDLSLNMKDAHVHVRLICSLRACDEKT